MPRALSTEVRGNGLQWHGVRRFGIGAVLQDCGCGLARGFGLDVVLLGDADERGDRDGRGVGGFVVGASACLVVEFLERVARVRVIEPAEEVGERDREFAGDLGEREFGGEVEVEEVVDGFFGEEVREIWAVGGFGGTALRGVVGWVWLRWVVEIGAGVSTSLRLVPPGEVKRTTQARTAESWRGA